MTIGWLRTAFLLALLAAFGSAAVALEPRLEAVRKTLLEKIAAGEIPTAAVGVVKDGKVVWEEGLGWADRERQIAATPETVYPVASVSKSLTATGLMVLVERGKVRLEEPVTTYLGPAPLGLPLEGSGAPSVRQVVTQTLGIPHLWLYEYPDNLASRLDRAQLIRRHAFVAFPPGKHFHYSNLNFAVAAQAVSVAAERPFENFMQEEVFAPLGMRQTSLDRWVGEEGVARGYDEGAPITRPFRLAPDGGAGFFSSAHDLLRYALFHLGTPLPDQKPVLRPESLALLHWESRSEAPNYRRYAMGWGIVDTPGLRMLISDGQMLGGTAAVVLVPEEKLGVVLLTNTSASSLLELTVQIVEALVPGTAGRFEKRVAEMEAASRSASSPLTGRWEGMIRRAEGNLAIALAFNECSAPIVQLGERFQGVLNDFAWEDGAMTGRIPGTLPFSGTTGSHDLGLTLWLDGDQLAGFIRDQRTDESARSGLPAFASLRRVK